MKIYLLIICFFYGLQGFCQASASASVNTRVSVIDPIKINKTLDLNFGNVISSYNPGSLILTPDGTRTANGVQISSSMPGDVSPAEAIVVHGNNSYSINLPDSFILYNQDNPNQILIINQFVVEPTAGTTAGTDILKIGATLNLEANQLSGFYTNTGGFNVTVSYN
ncbi:DUF4402 domain-containing protein [Salegentibacter chungangensis]|uniref:DUF4402 domain-containing protein n=1 Tax=Salegentibacter chungangensis TaxID=1335724 RepID=A0ABW3NSC8_9FLAO